MNLYERLCVATDQGIEEVLDSKPFAQALLGVIERHKPVDLKGVDNQRWMYCRGCHAPAEKCEELPAIGRALGIHV